jgi:hypothetical protein
VPKDLTGEFTAVLTYDTSPFQAEIKKATFTIN